MLRRPQSIPPKPAKKERRSLSCHLSGIPPWKKVRGRSYNDSSVVLELENGKKRTTTTKKKHQKHRTLLQFKPKKTKKHPVEGSNSIGPTSRKPLRDRKKRKMGGERKGERGKKRKSRKRVQRTKPGVFTKKGTRFY